MKERMSSGLVIILIASHLYFSCNKIPEESSNNPLQIVNYTEVLGRVSNSAITMNILFEQNAEVYWEYGTSPEKYDKKTPSFLASENIPLETTFVNLTGNTRYYYRTRYRVSGSSSSFMVSPEHLFHTQRSPGSTFSFAVEADPHLDYNSDTSAYSLTLKNILAVNPDFMLDLGDTFMSEKQPVFNQEVVTERHLLFRQFFNKVCHSVPLYLVSGNHEGELGWRLDGTEKSMPVMVANTRKLYYPNPLPDAFYSGNSKSENFVGLRQNYYAWEWGDALFVVLDPYWYTIVKPGWGWTLGADQYNWFKNTLSSSKSKFKFVFCHNLVGGNGNDARGGTEFAHLFEMGGYNTDGAWGFDIYRPGWGKPIHNLMKENNVTVFFHGHDHFYGKQEKDGVVYQEVPQPSNVSLTNISAAQYGYVNGVFMPGRGYLLITVSGGNVKVEYIGTYIPKEETGTRKNRDVLASYIIN